MDSVTKQVRCVSDGLNTKDRFSRDVVHQYLHFQLFIILETWVALIGPVQICFGG